MGFREFGVFKNQGILDGAFVPFICMPSGQLNLKKELKDGCYCFSCDSRMKLRTPKGKHQHFAHHSRQDCFEADSLLAIEIKLIPYKSDLPHEKPSHELEHTEGQHPGDEDWELEGEKLLKGRVIDFDKAYEEEMEHLKNDTALDILKVIEETKRRELLHDKKRRLLESYNKLILQLLEKKRQFSLYIKNSNII